MSGHAETIRAFYDAVNRGELEALDEYTGPTYTNHQLPPELPADLTGTKELFQGLREGFPDLNFEVEQVVENADRAAVWLRMTGTHLQDFMGIAATYKQIDVTGAEFIRFKQDKAVEHWGVFDRLTMLYQLDAMPEVAAE